MREESTAQYQIRASEFLPDGDELKIVLIRGAHSYKLTDEGHTLMYLSYTNNTDTVCGDNTKDFSEILKKYSIKNKNGRFVSDEIPFPTDTRAIEKSISLFAQGLLEIVSYAQKGLSPAEES